MHKKLTGSTGFRLCLRSIKYPCPKSMTVSHSALSLFLLREKKIIIKNQRQRKGK